TLLAGRQGLVRLSRLLLRLRQRGLQAGPERTLRDGRVDLRDQLVEPTRDRREARVCGAAGWERRRGRRGGAGLVRADVAGRDAVAVAVGRPIEAALVGRGRRTVRAARVD